MTVVIMMMMMLLLVRAFLSIAYYVFYLPIYFSAKTVTTEGLKTNENTTDSVT